jgi:hypothetical protein
MSKNMSHYLEESLLSVRIAEKGSEQKLVWTDGTDLDKYHCQTFSIITTNLIIQNQISRQKKY